MRADAQANLAQARKLGATEADIQKARQRMSSTYVSASILVGPVQACHTMVNNLAWVGTEPAQTQTGRNK